ncbi:MAG: prephenate dehydrogenase [Candidatus Omnitrophica bacterium]|nr:prephenate dehydrogenase [Candidatus Omnitrophota bacterium]
MQEVKKISIIGVGFMGGSFALGIKKTFPQIRIWGYARNLTSYNKLKKLNILDKVERNLKNLVSDADIVVLATPIYSIIEYFKKIAGFLKKNTIVIDIGSTKELICKYAKIYLPKYINFVGCHPLCGSQKSGANFSDPNLYRNAICIITTPLKNYGVLTVKELWEGLGSKVIFLSPSLHDKIISTFSHLPHIIAFSLINLANKKYLKFAPQSFKDLTRISVSGAHIWKDIFLSNKYIITDIKKFIKFLQEFELAIKGENEKRITKLINNANKKYSLFV